MNHILKLNSIASIILFIHINNVNCYAKNDQENIISDNNEHSFLAANVQYPAIQRSVPKTGWSNVLLKYDGVKIKIVYSHENVNQINVGEQMTATSYSSIAFAEGYENISHKYIPLFIMASFQLVFLGFLNMNDVPLQGSITEYAKAYQSISAQVASLLEKNPEKTKFSYNIGRALIRSNVAKEVIDAGPKNHSAIDYTVILKMVDESSDDQDDNKALRYAINMNIVNPTASDYGILIIKATGEKDEMTKESLTRILGYTYANRPPPRFLIQSYSRNKTKMLLVVGYNPDFQSRLTQYLVPDVLETVLTQNGMKRKNYEYVAELIKEKSNLKGTMLKADCTTWVYSEYSMPLLLADNINMKTGVTRKRT